MHAFSRTVPSTLALTLLAIVAAVACGGPDPAVTSTPPPTATLATATESPTGPPEYTPTPIEAVAVEAQPKPEVSLPTNTPAPTATPRPTTTPTPTPKPARMAQPLPTITLETTWLDVIDSLSAAQLDCVHDRLDEETLDRLYELPLLNHDPDMVNAESSVFMCMDEEHARTLLTVGISMIADLFVPMTDASRQCLLDWVNETELPRLLVTNDPELEDAIMREILRCAPDLLADAMLEGTLEELGIEDRVTPEETDCLRAWLANPDVATAMFLDGDGNPSTEEVAEWMADLFACAPSLFVVTLADTLPGEAGEQLLENEELAACVIVWAADNDTATVVAEMIRADEEGENVLAALARVAPGLIRCAPTLFIEEPTLPTPPSLPTLPSLG